GWTFEMLSLTLLRRIPRSAADPLDGFSRLFSNSYIRAADRGEHVRPLAGESPAPRPWPTIIVFLYAILAAAAFGAELFHDDFSRFPPGRLTGPIGELNGAIQEYHYLAHRGVPLGPWASAIC